MIKDKNVADDAQIQLHKILGSAGMFVTGEIFWVGNSGDAAYDAMREKVTADHLFTSIDTAVGSCTANRGDVIAVMDGHNEAITAAAGLVFDVAGVTVVFLGKGTTAARVTFGTDVGADMDISAVNVTLINPTFVAGIDSLTGPGDINASDFTMINVNWHDASNIETTDCWITDANATRLKILGYKYHSVTETGDQKQSHIQLNGCDDIILKDIDIRGDFFVGNIENVTDQVLNARFEDVYLENLNQTPTPALFLNANATGSCKNVKLKIYSGSTYLSSVGKMSWDDRCEGFMGDGYAGEPLGTVLATGIEGQIVEILSDLETVKSDLVIADAIIDTIYSDTGLIKTDTTEILSDLETVKSDLVIADAIIDTIYSDTGLIKTDTTEILSDLETISSDLIIADAIIDTIYSDTGLIKTDTTEILSDLETIKSDLIILDAIVDTEVGKTTTIASDLIIMDAILDTIYSDTGLIHTDTTEILSDLETISSDLVVLDAIVDTEVGKTTTIASDLVIMDAILDTIYSDTGLIHTDTTEILSDLETISSDLVIADAIIDTIASDLVIADAIIDAQPRCIAKTDGAVLNGDDALFTISGGPIRCKIVGFVTTIIGGAANSKLTLTTTIPSATVDLSNAAVAIDGDAAGTMYTHEGATAVFTPSTTLGYKKQDAVTIEETEWILSPGLIEFNSSGAQGGVIAWYMTYWPLSPLSVVTVEA